MEIRGIATAAVVSAMLSSAALANEGPVPAGVPHLDHVFLIMMENHGYGQIIGNPNAPFTNHLTSSANSATNYFAIAQRSASLPATIFLAMWRAMYAAERSTLVGSLPLNAPPP